MVDTLDLKSCPFKGIGSSPIVSILEIFYDIFIKIYAFLAQLVEHQPSKLGAIGSSPIECKDY